MRMFLAHKCFIEIQMIKIKQISLLFAHQKLSHIICYLHFFYH